MLDVLNILSWDNCASDPCDIDEDAETKQGNYWHADTRTILTAS